MNDSMPAAGLIRPIANGVHDPMLTGDHTHLHILVPLDGSQAAEGALEFVESLAGRFQVRVTLLRAVPPGEAVAACRYYGRRSVGGGRSLQASIPIATRVRLQAGTYLTDVARRLEARGIPAAIECPVDEPALAIVRRARQLHVGLIAMTTFGSGGQRRGSRGRTLDEVLRHAPCPVMTVVPQLIPSSPETGSRSEPMMAASGV